MNRDNYYISLKKAKELYHHGVKGQSWGVMHGPPYPLNQQGKNDFNKDHYNKLVSSGKVITDNLKDYKVGALMFNDSVYDLANSSNLRKLYTTTYPDGRTATTAKESGHDYTWQEVTNYGFDDLKGYHSVVDNIKAGRNILDSDDPLALIHNNGQIGDWDMDSCNPGYHAVYEDGVTNNCGLCSATLELKKRGYMVTAGRSNKGVSTDSEKFWFKGAVRKDTPQKYAQELCESYGNNTSGTISIRYPHHSGGHAMHWTVDTNGIFEIQDGQNGKRFNSVNDMCSTYGADPASNLSIFRLDNCEPNWNNIKSDSVIRNLIRPGEEAASYDKVKNRITGKVVDTW